MALGVAYTLTLRCQITNQPGMLGQLITTIGQAGGDIGAIDIVRAERALIVRDITVQVQSESHGQQLSAAVGQLPGVSVLQVSDRVFLSHIGGKLAIHSKVPLKTRDDLSLVYTPGVARVCSAIFEDPSRVYALTMKRNSVAVVTDGSAVLGLGNLGAEAALPVMEGKAILFKELADIDAFPLCLRSQDPETVIATVEQIAPVFGAINLEDIAAPNCFLIEERLGDMLDIPVMHDDQHGTAVVVLAALRNALRVIGKRMADVRVVVNGIGAAGTAIIRMLLSAQIGEIVACDRHGILCRGDEAGMTAVQRRIAAQTNVERRAGDLAAALVGADVFIGVSAANILTAAMVQKMAYDPVIFALANPIPEGDPGELHDYARIIATGRSDYPNQINNVLSFPGMFRGALDVNARAITAGMRLAAAEALAAVISEEEVNEDYIVPSVFNRALVPQVAAAVAAAAISEGVARRTHLPAS